MVGVVAHQGRKIESGGEAGLSLGEEITESLVGVFGGAESRELAHGPKTPAVHRGMDAARIRRLTGKTEVTFRIPVWQISLGIKPANRVPGDGREFRLSFGTFFQGRLQSVFFPGLLFGGWLARYGRGFCRRRSLGGSLGFFAHAHRSRERFKQPFETPQSSMLFERLQTGKSGRAEKVPEQITFDRC